MAIQIVFEERNLVFDVMSVISMTSLPWLMEEEGTNKYVI
jgi:hypothetical protein